MKRYFVLVLIFLSISMVFDQSLLADDTPAPFPLMEKYILSGQMEKYLPDAMRFLHTQRNSPYAPRVLFDLYALAVVSKTPKLAENTRALLLLQYPQSSYSRYIVTTFKNAKEYREFLSRQIKKRFDKITDTYSEAFVNAMRIGVKKFGKAFFDDEIFLLECYLIAQKAKNQKLKDILTSKIQAKLKKKTGNETDNFANLAAICLDDKLDTPSRIRKLSALDNKKSVQLFQKYYLSRLSQSERNQPDMLRVRVESLIIKKKFPQALALTKKLPTQHVDAQILFWRGWCLFSLQEPKKALASLKTVRQKYPKSLWAKPAAQMEGCIDGFEGNLKDNIDTFLAVLDKFKKQTEAFECELEITSGKNKANYRAYFATVFDENFLEFVVRKNKQTLLAFRVNKKTTDFYSRSSNKILRFPIAGNKPLLYGKLSREPNGKFTCNFFWGFSASTASKVDDNLLNSPYLTTRNGLTEFIAYNLRTGFLPATVHTTKKGKTFTWIIFQAGKPKTSQIQWNVNSENVLTSIACDDMRLCRICYGAKNSFKFSPPKWPNAKIEKINEKSAGLKLFSALLSEAGAILADIKPFE